MYSNVDIYCPKLKASDPPFDQSSEFGFHSTVIAPVSELGGLGTQKVSVTWMSFEISMISEMYKNYFTLLFQV